MTVEEPGEFLFRFGMEPESASDLEDACEAAKLADLPHGVSVRDRTHRVDAMRASRPEVELYFRVHKTGESRAHYTVELPHPVTDADAAQFNRLFGRSR